MMFFRKKTTEAASRQQDDEADLAIAARIAEVVRVAEHGGTQPEAAPPEPAHAPHTEAAYAAYPDVLSAIAEVEVQASRHAPEPVAAMADASYAHPPTAEAPVRYDRVPFAEPASAWSDPDPYGRFEPPASSTSMPAHSAPAPPALRRADPPPNLPPDLLPAKSGAILRASPDSQAVARPESMSPFALTPDAIAVDQLLQETSKHLRNMGSVNILVAGQTGVGKSTLINSVFGEQFAQTAAGRPVTQHAEWYTSETVPLRILDTRGLEAKDYAQTLHDMRNEIESLRAQRDERDQLHMAWVCISAASSRVQDCEVDIVRVLNKYDIPAIIVLTKDDDDPEFAEIVAEIMDQRRAVYASIVPVRALSRPRRPATGLEQLVVATFTALPSAHRAAFAAAQKINRDMNKSAAEDYVTAATSAAAAAAVIPLPFADMVTLAPIQASMLVGISSSFGLTFERPQILQLITTVLGCLALSMAGRWAVGTVLKFIPGPGSVIGAVMNAAVAGALTKVLGHTYIRFLYSFIETNGRVPTADETIEVFPAFFRAHRYD